MKTILALGLMATFAVTSLTSAVDGQQTEATKTLLDIVTALEGQDYQVTEISKDGGGWEVEAFHDDVAYELRVDRQTGEVISKHRDDADTRPPQDSLPLSKLLALLDKAGYRGIDDVSFERRSWEVEARHDGTERELRVDPKSGKVLSDRVDD